MLNKKLAGLLIALLAVAALAVACGGSSANTGGGGSAANVTVTGTEFKFDPGTITAKAGQTVNVTFKNSGSVQHTFVIKEANNFKLTADPGQSVNGTFTAPAAGTYTYFCDVAGHEDAGMKGTFTVQ